MDRKVSMIATRILFVITVHVLDFLLDPHTQESPYYT
jgi:hypothetical protein